MRVILTFYRNFFWFVLAISLFSCYVLWIYGAWQFVVVVFWIKIATNLLLGLFINIFSPEQFYFYHNLGYSKVRLFVLTFLLDMTIWLLLSILTIKTLL